MTEDDTSAERDAARTVRESCERIGVELSNILRALAPSEDVLTHFRAAQVEILKGLRAVIDSRIERATEGERKGRAVTIE